MQTLMVSSSYLKSTCESYTKTVLLWPQHLATAVTKGTPPGPVGPQCGLLSWGVPSPPPSRAAIAQHGSCLPCTTLWARPLWPPEEDKSHLPPKHQGLCRVCCTAGSGKITGEQFEAGKNPTEGKINVLSQHFLNAMVRIFHIEPAPHCVLKQIQM